MQRWMVLAGLASSSLALAEEPSSNIQTEREIRAPRETVFEVLRDTKRMAELAPDRCMRKWDVADDGQTFQVLYLIEAFRRTLDVTVGPVEAPRRLEWDHLGNKGFVTRFLLSQPEGSDGTKLVMTTYVAAPGWPIRRYYFKKVQPAWMQCQERLLDAVAEAVEG